MRTDELQRREAEQKLSALSRKISEAKQAAHDIGCEFGKER